MKHAGAETLAIIGELLAELRRIDGLREKSPGVFYRKGKPFLHFHEDPAGIFADIRLDGVHWDRMPVGSPPERGALLAAAAGEGGS